MLCGYTFTKNYFAICLLHAFATLRLQFVDNTSAMLLLCFYNAFSTKFKVPLLQCVMYDSYLLKDVHSVLVNFPREYAQESMMLYI